MKARNTSLCRLITCQTLLCLALATAAAQCAYAAWTEGGIPVSTTYGQDAVWTASLSNGDVAVVAVGANSSSQYFMVFQRISPSGDLLWGAAGVATGYVPWYAAVQAVVADAMGGFTVFWLETRYEEKYVSALHVNSDGVPSNSKVIGWTTAQGIEWGGAVQCSDNTILVAWIEVRTPSNRVWVDRVSAFGQSVWSGPLLASEGPAECIATPSATNGTILGLRGYSGEISAVRVSGDRQVLWQRTIQTAQGGHLSAASDGYGGAFFTWMTTIGSAYTAWSQRVSASGIVTFAGNGVALQTCEEPLRLNVPKVVQIAQGKGLFLTASSNSSPKTIRRAVVDTLGVILAASERLARTNYEPGEGVLAVSAGRALELFPDQPYYMRGFLITATCMDVWNDPMGTRLIRHESSGKSYSSAEFPDGSFLIAWIEAGASYKAFVTRRMSDGYFENPSASISAVCDVGNDEGGFVAVDVARSRFDSSDPLYGVTSYAVWRSRDPEARCEAIQTLGTATELLQELRSEYVDKEGPWVAMPPSVPITDGTWELVGYFPAMQLANYRVVVPTYADSTASSSQEAFYCVSAHTAETAVFFVSDVMGGHSVDNLAPVVTGSLNYSILPSGYRLSWSPSPSADITGYRVYGGAGADFPILPQSLLGTSFLPQFDLTGSAAMGVTHCRVTAIDRHGNESAGSAVLELSALKMRILDVPGDQGGSLRVSWPRHVLDVASAPGLIADYQVQRGLGGWQTISTLAATHADSYAVNVPTADILVLGHPAPHSHYRVVATSSAPGVMYASPPDSACSIDNLSPPKPAAILVDGQSYRYVFWTDPGLPDLATACVYRGTEPGFTPGVALGCPSDFYNELDLGWYFYRVQFADIHGNLSEFSDELHGRWPTPVPNAVPTTLRLYPCRPNPFNPRTTIKYDLPAAGPVRLSVFDVAGRLVRTLVDESMPQGSHEAAWDGRDSTGREVGSGSYLARLEFGGKVEIVRMGLVR
jgi:hypothetical protein